MIQRTDVGWVVYLNARFYHITPEWLDDMFRHQVKPRKAIVDGRDVLADGEREFNKLRYAVTHDGTAEEVFNLFAAFREALTGNLVARRTHGLKPVTKDGDEDLRAVADGAPVRPWNAAPKPDENLHEFIRGQRENRR